MRSIDTHMANRYLAARVAWGLLVSAVMLCPHSEALVVQAPSTPSESPSGSPSKSTARVLGTVTAMEGGTITVKSDTGVEQKVRIQDGTRMLQTAPGQTNLTGATAIHVQDLEVGDRVSARGTMSEDGAWLTATSLIAMKQADLQKKQDADREDWQKRGVGGVVKLVDPATATVTVTTGSGGPAKTLAVHAGKTTIIRRYANDSARLSDAKPATLNQVKPGNELQARGTRTADGSELVADEIVVGSFQNLAGAITGVDNSAGTITLTDLATKKPYVIRCTADSQLRKLPPAMAQLLAAKLKGQGARPPVGSNTGVQAVVGSSANSASATAGRVGSTVASSETAGAPASGTHPGGGDPQQMLSRAPAIQLSDLRKGDMVMVVATEGTAPGAGASPNTAITAGSSTAITLIAGVEPMLQASASGSQNLLSSSWSLGSGGAGAEASQ